jgi:hypothetical protein
MIVEGEVEAKNFVLYIGHLRGEGSQWCDRLRRTDGPVAGFVLVKGKRAGKGVDEPRIANEGIRRARRGRTLVCSLVEAHTIRPAPANTHILPNVAYVS